MCKRIDYVYNIRVKKYTKPDDIHPREKNVPISARVRSGLVEELKVLAAINENQLSGFIEKILEDYVNWAKENDTKD